MRLAPAHPKPRPFTVFAAAVAVVATTFGVIHATAHQNHRRFYVAYTAPSGYVIHTQACVGHTKALHQFEKAVIADLLSLPH